MPTHADLEGQIQPLEEFVRSYLKRWNRGYFVELQKMLFEDMISAFRAGRPDAVTRRTRTELEEAAREYSTAPQEYVDKNLARMRKRLYELSAIPISKNDRVYLVTVEGPVWPEHRGDLYLWPEVNETGGGTTSSQLEEDATGWLDDDAVSDFEVYDNRDEFDQRLQDFSALYSAAQKSVDLLPMLVNAWRVVLFDHRYAAALLRNVALAPECRSVLTPYCSLALRRELSATDLDAYLQVTTPLRVDAVTRRQVELSWARLLRALIYQSPRTLESASGYRWLEMIAGDDARFWRRVCADIYLRMHSTQLTLSLEVQSTFSQAAERYFDQEPGAVLSVLRPWIVDPLGSINGATLKDITDLFVSSAKRSHDTADCRWCITALMRILPLLPFEEDDRSPLIAKLFREFESTSWRHRPQLLYLYLSHLLRWFGSRRTMATLKEFERVFSAYRRVLLPPQITHLQLEYAAALYVESHFVNFADDDAAVDLEFVRLLRNDKVSFCESPLFSNDLNALVGVSDRPKPKKGRSRRSAMLSWLQVYMSGMRRLVVADVINQNPLRAREFRLATSVPDGRVYVAGLVERRLRDPAMQATMNSNWCAAATGLFGIVAASKHHELLHSFVSRAMHAGKYELVVYARPLFQALLVLHFYGNDSLRTAADGWADALFSRIAGTAPRLWWAYYAAIRYERDEVEQAFVDDLWHTSAHALKRAYAEGLSHDDGAVYAFAANDVILRHPESRFAKALQIGKLVPEVWNTIGTASLRAAADRTVDIYDRSAFFYHWADSCARHEHSISQKYRYNYIYARASAIASGSDVDQQFIRDTFRYLRSRAARDFSFREDRALPLAYVIVERWNELAPDTQEAVRTLLPKIDCLPLLIVNRHPRLRD